MSHAFLLITIATVILFNSIFCGTIHRVDNSPYPVSQLPAGEIYALQNSDYSDAEQLCLQVSTTKCLT